MGSLFKQNLKTSTKTLNIKISTTPGEPSWSNGICKWYNTILKETLLKVKEDPNCQWEVALAWAVSVKISLLIH